MDLYSGQPWWLIKNELDNYYNPLSRDIKTRVAVIGAGITGALVCTELIKNGIQCCVIDKRSVSTGSSSASTALLQYEIDLPLCKMIEKTGEQNAVTAYRSCLQSIDDLHDTFSRAGIDASFERLPSVYYASNREGYRVIKQELRVRKKHGLPVEFLDRRHLDRKFGIKAPGALYNTVSGQIDTYKAAAGLLQENIKNGADIFTHTEITGWHRLKDGYRLDTSTGHTIKCDYVVVATGFEAEAFLPRKFMQLTTTFAIISEPVDPAYLWAGRSLLWETRDPYLYIRTDNSNRIIVGGEDEPFNSVTARRFLIDRKSEKLRRKFSKLFPHIPFAAEFSWCGTFSSTSDGLPIVGATGDDPRMLYALGYGGNGITFSMIAAQILAAEIRGQRDRRAPVFSPCRASINR